MHRLVGCMRACHHKHLMLGSLVVLMLPVRCIIIPITILRWCLRSACERQSRMWEGTRWVCSTKKNWLSLWNEDDLTLAQTLTVGLFKCLLSFLRSLGVFHLYLPLSVFCVLLCVCDAMLGESSALPLYKWFMPMKKPYKYETEPLCRTNPLLRN